MGALGWKAARLSSAIELALAMQQVLSAVLEDPVAGRLVIYVGVVFDSGVDEELCQDPVRLHWSLL